VARYPAIAATSQAIVSLFEGAAVGTEFANVDFAIASAGDLQKPPGDRAIASIYLYRVAVDGNRRNQPARRTPDGRLRMPPIPIDLHYLLTAWSKEAKTQHRLLGWCIRVVQDNPTLVAGVLNQFGPDQGDVFRPDESVELVMETLTRQEMADAWEVAKANQQPSVSYMARIVEIESEVEIGEFPPVQTTDLRYHQVAS
jgi:Pvc16 N-terminal domain